MNLENSRDFTERLDSATSGRLVFSAGAGGVSLHADPALPDLCRAHFVGQIPSVRSRQGLVTIQYRRLSFFDWPFAWREPAAEVVLNGSLPWEIEFRDGVSQLTADLSHLLLRALDLSSASQVLVTLPPPTDTVYVHVSGSVSNFALRRPAGVAIRLHIGGSASNLTLDEQRFGAVAGGLRWQTSSFNNATDRYDLTISGSVSDLTLASR